MVDLQHFILPSKLAKQVVLWLAHRPQVSYTNDKKQQRPKGVHAGGQRPLASVFFPIQSIHSVSLSAPCSLSLSHTHSLYYYYYYFYFAVLQRLGMSSSELEISRLMHPLFS